MSILEDLSAPFDPSLVSWRVGSTTKSKDKGMALAYIDARDVMKRLDKVLGPENWKDRYEYYGNTAICYLSIRIDGEWIEKADGAGDTAVEAEKGRISDAFKRAAVKWGVGRYLYDIDSVWVNLEQRGNSYAIPKAEYDRLQKCLPGSKIDPGPPEPEPITAERMAFIIKEINSAKDAATVRKLNAAAQVECEKANDAAAWQEILKTAKERINQLQPPQENTIDPTN
ncbi:Rad52/Rad22 family DNA repair protein [Dyadobacter jiangsuensis]|uniref:Rad52/22 family double-strand break repair protein n=1 Tax=Dyadobacter jiangsuensis TaxID=1591085 RepID=A0A2P8FP00_9BACT|nr:Rad52/Rad22 family DNA repair protein [Dyadobacter jiangsuensis]PSL23450.1 Rad52/22 family double-strand break repair protein [Dyadobacter jiangsuensis]